jgi:hypothetical protein
LSDEDEAPKPSNGDVDQQNGQRDEMQKDNRYGYIRKKLHHA